MITNYLSLLIFFFLKKEQLTLEGIKKLVSIKSSMNLGLSHELKTIFSNIKPEKNYVDNISNYKIPDPN
jgi:hypothetical protein